MKNDYLTGQYVLLTEIENNFAKDSRLFSAELALILQRGDYQGYEKLMQSPFLTTLSPYVTENIDILKLYLAVHVADILRTFQETGLPSIMAETYKKQTFQSIVNAKKAEDLSSLLQHLMRELQNAHSKYCTQHFSYTIRRAIDFIYTKRFQPLKVSDVADALRMERTSLSKRFHRETGRTMISYIHSIKADLAETLLQGNVYSLSEIADMLGYASYDSFSKAYKRCKGHSPSHRQ